jgi:hypothetical protein
VSLLDRGDGYIPCKIYPELSRTDADGNTVTYCSPTPIETVGRFWVQNQSGTSSRLLESNDEGYQTELVYMAQFPRSVDAEHGPFGAQSQVSWGPPDSRGNERRWEFFGDALQYTGSRRTKHNTYTLRRY